MADIFQEVDEEVRRERLKKLWDRWGNVLLVLACLIVIGIGGWRAWEWWEAKKAAEAGDAFEAALTLAEAGKNQEADAAFAAFAAIAAKAPAGYRMLARFRTAEELSVRDRPGAVKAFDALAADSNIGRVMQDLAAVRAGMLLADTASYEEMRTRLEPQTAAGNPFRHTAREMIALAAWRTGDMAAAKRWFEMITADGETPAGTRSRVEMLMALVAGEGKG